MSIFQNMTGLISFMYPLQEHFSIPSYISYVFLKFILRLFNTFLW